MKIKKAVIPVAGMGTRFLPITKSVPKEMLPIIDKPILQYIVEEAYESGIEEILFVTNSYKKCIEDYFDSNFELEQRLIDSNKLEYLDKIKNIYNKVKIYYIREGNLYGSGYAVSLAQAFVGNEAFAVMYGDNLMYSSGKPVLKQLIDMAEANDCSVIGCMNIDLKLSNKYGMIKLNEDGTIKKIVEKPDASNSPSSLAGLGRYIVKPEIFDYLNMIEEVNGEYQFTDAMTLMMQEYKFLPCQIIGKYYDIGSKEGFLKANIEYALRDDELKDEIKNIINDISQVIT